MSKESQRMANTFFAVKTNGRLSAKVKRCESHPTWPNGDTRANVEQMERGEQPKK